MADGPTTPFSPLKTRSKRQNIWGKIETGLQDGAFCHPRHRRALRHPDDPEGPKCIKIEFYMS